MMKKQVSTNKAPKAVGPYSQAIEANGFVYLSGQISLTAEGEFIDGSAEEQTHQIMKNLAEVLKASGCDFGDVVKTEIFLSDMNDYSKVNEVYESYLSEPYPARVTVEVARIPRDGKVEISMIAVLKEKAGGCCCC